MNKFAIVCFFRGNNKRLIEELKKIGYTTKSYFENSEAFISHYITIHTDGTYGFTYSGISILAFDCGTNEDFFLKVASIRHQEYLKNIKKQNNMNKIYQVKESDLIGDIEGFPIEIAQAIINHQYEQYGFNDIGLLQKDILGVFTWYTTLEGHIFWNRVISEKKFDLFFKEYPKKEIMNDKTYKVTRQQMGEIYSIACLEWKDKISNITSEYFSSFVNEVSLPHKIVKEMFDAATDEQKKVLESIFIDYNKKVIKEGTSVMASDGYSWILGFYSGGNEVNVYINAAKKGCPLVYKHIVPVSDFNFDNPESNISKSIV